MLILNLDRENYLTKIISAWNQQKIPNFLDDLGKRYDEAGYQIFPPFFI